MEPQVAELAAEIEPELQPLLQFLQQPACLVDPTARIVKMNAAWSALRGSARPDDRWLHHLADEDRRDAMSQLLTTVMSGERASFECRLLDAQGQSRWFMLDLQPTGRVPSAPRLCVATDIHALKSRELALRSRAHAQTEMLNVGLDCIKLISNEGRLIHLNRSGHLALGVPEDGPLGMEWLPLLPPEVHAEGERALAAARSGTPARFPGRSERPGQKPQYWDNMLTPLLGKDGEVNAILCVSREVTAEREALVSLQQSQERLAIAAGVGGLGVWDYDLKSDRLNCDEAWYRIMGRDPARPIRSVAEFRPFIHPEDVEQATAVDTSASNLIDEHGNYGIVFRIVRPNGEIRWVRSAARVLSDGAGAPARAVGFIVDITDTWRGELALREANRVLEEEKRSFARQSLEDPLTGLANRRFLDSELARICVHANQHRLTVAMAMIDADHFKAYNDHYGHLQGDEALRAVAAALQSVARRSDFVARYGGEEFLIVFPGLQDPKPALERLMSAVEALQLPHARSPEGRLTISVGCVVFASDGELVPAAMLKRCDEALYEAKAAGRNRHVLFL